MNSFNLIENKKVLITGHTGFKGSWLAFFLNSLNCEIFGISDIEYNGIYKLTNVKNLFREEVFLDISNISSEEIFKTVNRFEPEIIFHFAAQSLVKKASLNPHQTIDINALGTLKILEVANNCESVEVITIATTDKVYSNPSKNNVETDNLHGSEFYSASKVAAENYITAFCGTMKRDSLNVVTIRSGNVIGGGDRGVDRLFTDIVNFIFDKQKLTIRNPKHIRPWTYILDSLNGYISATQYCIDNKINEVFNLNSITNNNFDVEYILDRFKQLTNIEFLIEDDFSFNLKEVETLKINSNKAKDLLNWKPKLHLDEIIELTYNWELNHLQENSNDYSINEIKKYLEI
tara:strand:- start:5959 stop:6999 length:1041 start_codon:yes stop_codon:yes gene_type:complete